MNSLSGHIVSIEAHGSVAIVDVAVATHRFTATLLGSAEQLASWKIGQSVRLLFKETEVALAKNLSGQISLRNRFPGSVTKIEIGQVLTRVIINMNNVEISSVITSRSARGLQLALGDQVEGLVKSNEMSLLALGGE
ncbi:MAG: TOBE domain-containing protein [Undibacterium sp.]|uniref:TOBE domain-containing protein n=1 Tax=Undibacterium sp. TaxID=1914977 RepID=UPI0027182D00|nr:TOBE domain-containing protein [Undibacterium sp.]MDO8653241.1 TOBE domain-containing protein [Undibacterium sp.]